jgi:hypothetical protein
MRTGAITLNGVQQTLPPTAQRWDGIQDAQAIAMRLGLPPKGYANWSMKVEDDRYKLISVYPKIKS